MNGLNLLANFLNEEDNNKIELLVDDIIKNTAMPDIENKVTVLLQEYSDINEKHQILSSINWLFNSYNHSNYLPLALRKDRTELINFIKPLLEKLRDS